MSDLFTQCIAQIAPGVQLVVLDLRTYYTASVVVGEWPDGAIVSTNTHVDLSRSRVDIHPKPSLWLGGTSYTLPWLELLKVADFLRLPIPLPVPDGEQVPA